MEIISRIEPGFKPLLAVTAEKEPHLDLRALRGTGVRDRPHPTAPFLAMQLRWAEERQ
jgi:hypothetical protein